MIDHYWLVPPLILIISLVYAASRHEAWGKIWRHTARLTFTILLVMVVFIAFLLFINSRI